MNNRLLIKCVVLALVLFCASNPLSAQLWSNGYWEGDPAVLTGLDWSALTHITAVAAQPNSDGSINLGCWNEGNNCPEVTWAAKYITPLVTTAHSHGVKVLLDLHTGSDGGAAWASATNGSHVSTFATNAVALLARNNIDGMDLDWEGNFGSAYYSQLSAFITAVRAQLPAGKLITASVGSPDATFWGSQASKMDQINEMTYDMVGNWNPYSWFNAPIYSDPCNCVWSLELNRTRMLQGGVPASKLGLGVPFYGYVSTGGSVTGPRQSNAGNPSLSQRTYTSLVANFNLSNPTYDSVGKVPWVGISGGWITFDNPQSITDKIHYMQGIGVSGFIIFSLEKDYMAGQTPTHPLLAAVKAARLTGSAPTISSFTSNPSTITSGASSTLSWATSGATGLSINQGVGTVSGQTSTVVSPGATTTYTLTAINSAGSVTKSATVTVTANTSPPTISSFAANPAMTAPGGSSMLSWATTGATSLSISPGVGVVANNTSIAVSPSTTTTYTLTATNANGSATQPVTVTLSSAPVAYWKFDDGSGTTAADSSGFGHSMALFNAPGWLTTSSCAVNGCLGFNGANQYGSSALDLSGTNVITIAFWLKWTQFSNDNRIALEFTPNFNNASTGFLILPDEAVSGQFQGGFQGNAGYNQVNFPRPSAGVWHHYAFVMNKGASAATQVIPYVDGQAISYTKPAAAANTNNFGKDLLFAMSRAGTSLFGSGNLDEVRIYPRALSAAEILSLVTASSPNITTTSPLQVGTVGLPYWQTLTSSGSTPITWTLTSGALPAGLFLSSSNGAISGTPSTASSFSFIVGATNTAGTDSQQFSLTVNPNSSALNYNVSDLNWMSATIGWGTIHKNASVLGNVLTLNGVTYTEGIGTHANSQIVYNIGGGCNTFQSDVGVDDEVGSAGLVRFQVFGDSVKLYDSSLMTGSSATQKISISVAGHRQLSLLVNDGPDGINFDHADWANPRLACSSVPPAAN